MPNLIRPTLTRQERAIARSDRLARHTAAVAARTWSDIIGVIARGSRGGRQDRETVAKILRAMLEKIQRDMFADLRSTLEWGYTASVDAWLSQPKNRIEAALRRKAGLQETAFRYADVAAELPKGLSIGAGMKLVIEPDLTKEKFQALLKQILFKPPTRARAQEILRASNAPGRPAWPSKLAAEGLSFDKIFNQVSSGMAGGENVRDIAKRIEPLVNGVRHRATRIARTESLRVADEIQREAWRHTEDLNVGYQVIATLDEYTRPEHRARHGTVYRTQAEAPTVPDAPNCRCIVLPLLSMEEAAENIAAAN